MKKVYLACRENYDVLMSLAGSLKTIILLNLARSDQVTFCFYRKFMLMKEPLYERNFSDVNTF